MSLACRTLQLPRRWPARAAPPAGRAARRMCPSVAPSPGRRASAVRVVAFRDVHREEMITKMGAGLVNAWFKGMRDGTGAVRDIVHATLDTNAPYTMHAVVKSREGRGADFMLAHLEEERGKVDVHDWRIIADAACSEDDTYFSLVEVRYSSKTLGGPPCTVLKVFNMDVFYDDTALRALSVHERTQLLPEDVACIASLDSAQKLCTSTAFPEDRVIDYPSGLDNEVVVRNSRAWCQARSTGQNEDVLDAVLDPSFRLWDAYGMLPVICDRSKSADSCVVHYDQVKEIIRQTKTSYSIKCKQLDCAVSASKAIAFTHWRSIISPKTAGGDGTFQIDGIEVDVFGKDGRIKDIWLFRDAMDHERAALEST